MFFTRHPSSECFDIVDPYFHKRPILQTALYFILPFSLSVSILLDSQHQSHSGSYVWKWLVSHRNEPILRCRKRNEISIKYVNTVCRKNKAIFSPINVSRIAHCHWSNIHFRQPCYFVIPAETRDFGAKENDSYFLEFLREIRRAFSTKRPRFITKTYYSCKLASFSNRITNSPNRFLIAANWKPPELLGVENEQLLT